MQEPASTEYARGWVSRSDGGVPACVQPPAVVAMALPRGRSRSRLAWRLTCCSRIGQGPPWRKSRNQSFYLAREYQYLSKTGPQHL